MEFQLFSSMQLALILVNIALVPAALLALFVVFFLVFY
jgi:hypothetical protein